MIDLDNISRCPLGDECSACGVTADELLGEELFTATVSSPVGVYCTTLCPSCTWRGTALGAVPVVTATRRSLEHCGHLGITADEMATAMEQEES